MESRVFKTILQELRRFRGEMPTTPRFALLNAPRAFHEATSIQKECATVHFAELYIIICSRARECIPVCRDVALRRLRSAIQGSSLSTHTGGRTSRTSLQFADLLPYTQ